MKTKHSEVQDKTYKEGNASEDYFRDRIRKSPLASLVTKGAAKKTTSTRPTAPTFSAAPAVKTSLLSPGTYPHIKNVVIGLILNSILDNPSVAISTVCGVILAEVKDIESRGLDYILSLEPVESEGNNGQLEIVFEPFEPES